MRKAIRNKLILALPEISGRVYETSMAGPNTTKPYAVVKSGGDVQTGMRYGFDVPMEVWLYCDRTSYEDLDALETKTIRALMRKELTTSSNLMFSLEYIGSSQDFYDMDWKALARQLRFRTSRIRGG